MNRILNATKLDFLASMSSLKLAAIFMILAAVVGLASHGPDYTMMIMMVFGVTSCGSIFSIHEKSHSDKLYGILPLKKTEMIAGRYLYALIIGVVYVIVASILGAIMSNVMNANMTTLTYWVTIGVECFYYCFAVGITYPIYLRFTFAKAYVFTMIPMYIIVVAFLIITRKTDLTSTLSQAIKFFTAHLYLAPIFGILGGLLLLLISALIANLIYTRKEI